MSIELYTFVTCLRYLSLISRSKLRRKGDSASFITSVTSYPASLNFVWLQVIHYKNIEFYMVIPPKTRMERITPRSHKHVTVLIIYVCLIPDVDTPAHQDTDRDHPPFTQTCHCLDHLCVSDSRCRHPSPSRHRPRSSPVHTNMSLS